MSDSFRDGKQYIIIVIILKHIFLTLQLLFLTTDDYTLTLLNILLLVPVTAGFHCIFLVRKASVKKLMRIVYLSLLGLDLTGRILNGTGTGVLYDDANIDVFKNSIASTFGLNVMLISCILAAFLIFNKDVKLYIKSDK